LGVQHFDLYYTTPETLSAWKAWDTVETAPPRLPIPPLDFRQQWVLPPGVVPLSGAWQRPAGRTTDAAGLGWNRAAQAVWQTGQPRLAAFLPELATPPWVTTQRQHLAAAGPALQRQLGPDDQWVLGPTLEALILDQLKDQVAVVIDAEALAAAGLSP